MKKHMKQLLCLLLCALITLSVLPYAGAASSDYSQRKAIAEVAKAELEIGVSGRPNKYTYWYSSVNGYYSGSWCAVFVSWCAAMAGVSKKVIKPTASAALNSFDVPYHKFSPKAKIKQGDILYCKNSAGYNHVALVCDVDKDYIYTVEGNMSDRVREFKYRRSDGYISWSSQSSWQQIAYYGVPKYDNKYSPFKRTVISKGSCGSGVKWTLYTDSTLVISGKGAVPNYSKPAPWDKDAVAINRVVVGKSVTSVGKNAFAACKYLRELTLLNKSCKLSGSAVPKKTSATLKGLTDSTAESFAKKYSLEFVSLSAEAKVQGLELLSQNSNSVTLSWTEVPNASYYNVQVKEAGTWKQLIKAENPASCRIPDLKPNKDYSFRVQAVAEIEGNSYKGTASKALNVGTGFSAIKDFCCTGTTADSATFTWKKCESGSIYRVYVKDDSGKWVCCDTVSGTSLTVTGLESLKDYSFRARTIRKTASGTWVGTYTEPVTVTTAPGKVDNLKQTDSRSTYVNLSWDAHERAEGYRVYRYREGSWEKCGETADTSIKIESLTPDTEYQFKVRAFGVKDEKRTYGKMSDKLTARTAPKKVGKLTLKNSAEDKKSAVLSWSKVEGAEGYRVYTVKGSVYTCIEVTKANKLTLKKGKVGSTVTYAVKAYSVRDNVKYYGDMSSKYKFTWK